jgi:hypothetical protein
MAKTEEKEHEAVWKADAKAAEKPVEPPKVVKPKVALLNDVEAAEPEDEFIYPFVDMKPGQGFFVPNEPNMTTAQTLAKLNTHVARANDWYGEVELDRNGDEIWEDAYVRSTKLNPDGSLQLDGAGKVIYGHDPISRPKLISSRQYVARRIAKGDEFADKTADVDGVLIVRVV